MRETGINITGLDHIFNGSLTQSMLVICRVRFSCRHMLAFVDIPGPKRYSHTTHRFNTVSIRYIYTQFCIYEGFCAYEKYVMNFHTQLLHFSHTQQCDRAIRVGKGSCKFR